ncbi:transketolase [Fimbriiglobus ruber]|uniref:Transketolase n=1 Tax=Fimbriiglobus ruber TaxID=1908690 RepID=A0A225E033_9BACT|nr:transketolase [Fimbriiglobus ruber]OWK47110.1 Transketolase [Fimbriiglobus ruber]
MAEAAAPPAPEFTAQDVLCVNTIRTLAMDAVQQANSGHPGAPMGLAPVAYTLWQRFLRYDPQDTRWPNRDRFVLSNGHASMLLYSLLHLAGVNENHLKEGRKAVTLDEIKRFRQLNSITPGHPESHLTAGIETTTGPLGQGVANSVGMAIAGKWLAANYNKPGFEDLFDFRVYAICGDGCMMEGISSEAASMAAHMKLNNLCWIYDDNGITIEGHTDIAFTEDVAGRFMAYGWNVLRVSDANDMARMAGALETFQKTTDRPTFVIVKTHIAWGAPTKQDTNAAHGEPLGDEEIKLTKRFYKWPEDQKFLVPDGVYDHFKNGIGKRGAELHTAWKKKFEDYKAKFPALATQIQEMQDRALPAGWDKDLPVFPADAKGLATRDSSGKVLNGIAKNYPWFLGGAADLAPSTKTKFTFEGAGTFTAKTPGGRNFHFGVREHAMGAAINGMCLTGLRPFAAGFLIFSDYGKTPIRLAGLMEIPVIYVFTHDSIGVGEDGPTHQPIEQLASLRATPGLIVYRPADANEVAEAYRFAMTHTHEPAIFALSRQAVPTFDRTKYAPASGVAKGGYVLADAEGGKPDVILVGTGTEVPLCVEVYEKLKAEGVKARVVSLPSWELFEKQSQEYRDSVLPPAVKARVCVEMAAVMGWERYAGPTGEIIGMRGFGASAPLKDLLKHFGFTVDNVYKAAKKQLGKA